jgi:hypothetical protein
MMTKSTMILLAVCAVLAVAVSPWIALLLMAVAIACGTAAVYAMLQLVHSHLPRGVNMAGDVTHTIVSSLINESNRQSNSRLPAFIPVRGAGRADFLDRLYAARSFKSLCSAIALLGPAPCLPALAYLERQLR